VLKQKRLYEGQRETLYNQQFNLEQVQGLEWRVWGLAEPLTLNPKP